jgi:hypothetical protein
MVQDAIEKTVESTVDSAAEKTGKTVGESIGEKVGSAIVRHYTPQFASLYAEVILGYAFHSGMYWIDTVEYNEGEWTKWRSISEGEENYSTMEKAYLKQTDEKKEWWKVKFYDASSDDTVVLEGLFAPNRSQLLRLRGKFPDQEAGEIPVREGIIYNQPTQLTEDSLEGATVGTEEITVPAGTFSVKHLQYKDAVTGSTTDWYLSEKVPGGMVKYSVTSKDSSQEEQEVKGLSQEQYVFELVSYGTEAKSELNSF